MSNTIELRVVLSRIASELAGMRDIATSAEQTVTDLLMEGEARCNDTTPIQELDRLAQSLGCLSQVVLTLSERCPQAAALDRDVLADRMKLVSISQRLLFDAFEPQHDPGDIDLF